MKKTKTFGPANDDKIPDGELLLAKLVQNAKSRGFGVVWGPAFCNVDDKPDGCSNMTASRSHEKFCCAQGAARLESDTTLSSGLADGHEGTMRVSLEFTELAGYAAGAAFADAMGGKRRTVKNDNPYSCWQNLEVKI